MSDYRPELNDLVILPPYLGGGRARVFVTDVPVHDQPEIRTYAYLAGQMMVGVRMDGHDGRRERYAMVELRDLTPVRPREAA